MEVSQEVKTVRRYHLRGKGHERRGRMWCSGLHSYSGIHGDGESAISTCGGMVAFRGHLLLPTQEEEKEMKRKKKSRRKKERRNKEERAHLFLNCRYENREGTNYCHSHFVK